MTINADTTRFIFCNKSGVSLAYRPANGMVEVAFTFKNDCEKEFSKPAAKQQLVKTLEGSTTGYFMAYKSLDLSIQTLITRIIDVIDVAKTSEWKGIMGQRIQNFIDGFDYMGDGASIDVHVKSCISMRAWRNINYGVALVRYRTIAEARKELDVLKWGNRASELVEIFDSNKLLKPGEMQIMGAVADSEKTKLAEFYKSEINRMTLAIAEMQKTGQTFNLGQVETPPVAEKTHTISFDGLSYPVKFYHDVENRFSIGYAVIGESWIVFSHASCHTKDNFDKSIARELIKERIGNIDNPHALFMYANTNGLTYSEVVDMLLEYYSTAKTRISGKVEMHLNSF